MKLELLTKFSTSLPVSVNNLKKPNYYKRTMYHPPEVEDFRNQVKEIFKSLNIETLSEDLYIHVDQFFGSKRQKDIDNSFKCLLDAFTKSLLIKDDKIFKQLTTEIIEDKKEEPHFDIYIFKKYGDLFDYMNEYR